MRTMFRVYNIYPDYEGRNFITTEVGLVPTLEKAIEIANDIKDAYRWTIVKETLNETTFTVKTETVKTYDYWYEVGRYEDAQKTIDYHNRQIAELEKSIARCTTEKGKEKRRREIEMRKGQIRQYEKVLAERG